MEENREPRNYSTLTPADRFLFLTKLAKICSEKKDSLFKKWFGLNWTYIEE
jgi:hypothetical protein